MTAVGDRAIAGRTVLASIVAAVLNAAIVAVTRALALAPGFEPISYPPVVLLTVLGTVAAGFVFAAVHRLSTAPRRTFVRVAVGALLLSFVPDVVLLQAEPTATLVGVLVLMVMHVVAAAVIVTVLTRGIGSVA